MPKTTHRFDATRIALYCRTRLTAHLAPDDLLRLRAYLELCLAKGAFPPYRGHAVDAMLLSKQTGIETAALRNARPHIQPLCDALCRALASQPLKQPAPAQPRPRRTPRSVGGGTGVSSSAPGRPGPKPRPIVSHPEPLWHEWSDPTDLASALRLHLVRHGESVNMLARAVTAAGTRLERHTLENWMKARSSPRSIASLEALDRIQARYMSNGVGTGPLIGVQKGPLCRALDAPGPHDRGAVGGAVMRPWRAAADGRVRGGS